MDDIDRRIAQLEHELAALKQERVDRDLAAFVQTIATVVGPNVAFSAGDLIAHAAVDPALAQAIQHLTAKEIGRRLARVARRQVSSDTQVAITTQSDLVLVCIGRDRDGCLYVISQTSSR